jgi:hypothetical protein
MLVPSNKAMWINVEINTFIYHYLYEKQVYCSMKLWWLSTKSLDIALLNDKEYKDHEVEE